MKEYKFYNSSTLKTVPLIENTSITFDIARENKLKILFNIGLYRSRYNFPIDLMIYKIINNDDVTPFGIGENLNIIYEYKKVGETIQLIYPTTDTEDFIASGEKVDLNENEYISEYYSLNTTNTLKVYVKNNEATKYIFKIGKIEVIFELELYSSLKYNSIVKIGKKELNLYYTNGKISEISSNATCQEKIYFTFNENRCSLINVKKHLNLDTEVYNTISSIMLNYSDFGLERIQEKYDNKNLSQRDISFTFNAVDNSVLFKDEITTNLIRVVFEKTGLNYQVNKIVSFFSSIIIDYSSKYKTIINEDNVFTEYYLNENYDLLYIQMDNGYVKTFNFQKEGRYNLLGESSWVLTRIGDNPNELLIDDLDSNCNYFFKESDCPSEQECLNISLIPSDNPCVEIIYFTETGSKFDTLNFILWSKYSDYTSNSNIELITELRFYKNQSLISTLIEDNINSKFNNNLWNLSIATAQTAKDYDEVKVIITFKNSSEANIELCYGLFKGLNYNIYKYNEYGRLIKSLFNNNIVDSYYDSNNNKLLNEYLINSYLGNKVVNTLDVNKTENHKTYDAYDNLTQNRLETSEGECIVDFASYINNEFLNFYSNNLGKVTYLDYNDRYQCTIQQYEDYIRMFSYYEDDSQKYGNIRSIKDNKAFLEHNLIEYSYDAHNNLILVKNINNDLVNEVRYVYDDYNRINYVTCSDIYTQNIILQINYNNDGMIESICNGDRPKLTEFEYYDTKLIKSIKYDGNIKYHFEYDEHYRLKHSFCHDSEIVYTYEYDDNNFRKIYREDFVSMPFYNINKQIIGETNIIDDNVLNTKYTESNIKTLISSVSYEYELLSSDEDLYFTLFNKRMIEQQGSNVLEDASMMLLNKENSIYPLAYHSDTNKVDNKYYESGLTFLDYKNNNRLYKYVFDDELKFQNNFSVFFGVILKDVQNDVPILKLGNNNLINGEERLSLTLKYKQSNFILALESYENISGGESQIINIPLKEIYKSDIFYKLNFINVNVSFIQQGSDVYYYTVELYLNDEYLGMINFDLGHKINYVSFLSDIRDKIYIKESKLTSIIINRCKTNSAEIIANYCNKLREIYSFYDTYVDYYNINLNHKISSELDVLLINKSLNSSRGLRPMLFKSNNKLKSLNDNFVDMMSPEMGLYNDCIYVVRDQILKYNLSLNKTGTVAFKYKAIEGKNTQLIYLKDDGSDVHVTISLNDGVINVDYLGGTISAIPENKFSWNLVTVQWGKKVRSESIQDYEYELKVYLNNQTILDIDFDISKDITNMLLNIGSNENSTLFNDEIKAYIDKLYFCVGDFTYATAKNWYNNISYTVNKYDKLRRVKHKVIGTNYSHNIKHDYTYKYIDEENNQTSYIINKEVINIDNIKNSEIDYTYNEYGNLENTKIYNKDNVKLHDISYEYDEKMQIKKETIDNDIYKYVYNDDGTLKEVILNDNKILDLSYVGYRLMGNNTLNYSYLYNGMYIDEVLDSNQKIVEKYTWNINNKLYQLKKNGLCNEYLYDHNGQRINKNIYQIEGNNNVLKEKTCYYYNDSGLLIGEKKTLDTDNNQLYKITYLHDLNNNIYGFILDDVFLVLLYYRLFWYN